MSGEQLDNQIALDSNKNAEFTLEMNDHKKILSVLNKREQELLEILQAVEEEKIHGRKYLEKLNQQKQLLLEIKRENKKLQKKLMIANSKYSELKNSRSWRYTALLRKILGIFRKMK